MLCLSRCSLFFLWRLVGATVSRESGSFFDACERHFGGKRRQNCKHIFRILLYFKGFFDCARCERANQGALEMRPHISHLPLGVFLVRISPVSWETSCSCEQLCAGHMTCAMGAWRGSTVENVTRHAEQIAQQTNSRAGSSLQPSRPVCLPRLVVPLFCPLTLRLPTTQHCCVKQITHSHPDVAYSITQ